MSISPPPPTRRGPLHHRWEKRRPRNLQRLISFGLLGMILLLVLVLGVVFYQNNNSHTKHVTTEQSLLGTQTKPLSITQDTAKLMHGNLKKTFFQQEPMADAIIVGSGLAGLTTALTVLDRGGTVLILEKEAILGGNSNKASSGINACCLKNESVNNKNDDTLDLFKNDTLRSAGNSEKYLERIKTLVQNSASAVTWLHNRVGVDLSSIVQLGGHSRKRTHRPNVGFVGAEIMNALTNAIAIYETKGQAHVMIETRATRVLKDASGHVRGVEVFSISDSKFQQLRADQVVLATGGFAADRSHGSLLEQYRPELLHMAATAGSFSTGDGVRLAQRIGAGTIDMEKVQIHPTGFVDPTDVNNGNKVLAAELLRGVGGIMLDKQGKRFCNELGTRAYIADKMLKHEGSVRNSTLRNGVEDTPTFYLVLSAEAASQAKAHVDMYIRKGLMKRVVGLVALSSTLNVDYEVLHQSLKDYLEESSHQGPDTFGKTVFNNAPTDLDNGHFFIGVVTPVLHYCMGGVSVNVEGEVLDMHSGKIPGLLAAGEVTGGLHGENRLGGNSLLECVVYGSIVGRQLQIYGYGIRGSILDANNETSRPLQKIFSADDVSRHSREGDCFVILHGNVYDLSGFASRHPGGKSSVLSLCGSDGTSIFSGVHGKNILSGIERHRLGIISAAEILARSEGHDAKISREELQKHNSADDCWLLLHGEVYDLTKFSKNHPGGAYIIQKYAGKDATDSFQVFHPREKLNTFKQFRVGYYHEG